MRNLLLAVVLCGAAISVAPPVQARGLTTTPDESGAMLIPTHTGALASVIPVRFWHHRHWHYRHWHRHYR